MGIDCPEDDDIPPAATRSGDVDWGDVGSDDVSPDDIAAEAIAAEAIAAEKIGAEAIGADKGREVADESTAVASEFAAPASREESHAEYRAKVEAVYVADARQRWEEAKPGFEEEWHRYADEHPTPSYAPADINEEVCTQIERGSKEIRETEENIVTPAMTRIEGEDHDRLLVGLEFRCKGQDRLIEKVTVVLKEQSDLKPSDALASVKDAIRYTFQYTEQHYTEGVRADIGRLKAEGCQLADLRNSWGSEEYKGINSRWRVPENGQPFEVQFHTQVSFEAKQLTHQAYERIRSTSTTKAEQDVLVDFQRRVNVYVPEPQRAREIPDFP
jgi:hypothetical protein